MPALMAKAAHSSRARTVLLVDDEPSIRRLLSGALTRRGLKVVEAGDGTEALEAFHGAAGDVDLLITDMRMPRLGGCELVRALRSRRPDLKILCITGFPPNVSSDLDVAMLVKPFTCHDLMTTVGSLLS
jgi:CheY-like chemotaxis protein